MSVMSDSIASSTIEGKRTDPSFQRRPAITLHPVSPPTGRLDGAARLSHARPMSDTDPLAGSHVKSVDTPAMDPSAGALPKVAKRKGRDPITWITVATVDTSALSVLKGTPFRPFPLKSGESEIRTPAHRADHRGLALVRLGRDVGGTVTLQVPSARKARRSEQAVEESAYSYLRLGISRVRDLEPSDQSPELLRLLTNATVHVTGLDVGRPRPQLTEMRGRPVRGGLPSLGKRT